MTTEAIPKETLTALTTQVAAAYVSKNPLPAAELPGLIKTVYDSLAQVSNGRSEVEKPVLNPAVPIKKSVTPDHIICLEDGKKLKMLKRHLRTTYNMSPDEYRAKWGLPADYPMVAPNYAAQRSVFAKNIGLGRKSTPEEAKAKGRRKATANA